jgi:O-antigen ligase
MTVTASARPLLPISTGAAGSKPLVETVAWAVAATLIAFVQAFAGVVDWKLGLVTAVALVFAVLLLERPMLLLPIAAITIFIESVTFSGMTVTRMLAPGALLLATIETIRGRAGVRMGPPLVCTALYTSWAIASGLWTQSVEGTLYLLQSLAIALVYLFAFAAMVKSESELRLLLYAMAFGASFIGGLSLLAFGSSLEIPYLELLQAGRSQGGVGDPDFFAAMQIVMVPLVLVLATDAHDKLLRMALYGAALTLLASAFTSLSRGGFLGIALLGILLIASNPQRVFRSRREKAAALLVVAIGMAVLFSRPFVRQEVVDRARTIYAPQGKEDKTGSGRTNLWKAAARTAAENPFTGVGFGSFKYISEDLIYHTPGVDLEVYGGRREGDNFAAHNTYVGTAAELGFTGLALYLTVILSTGLYLRQTARRALALGQPFVSRVAHALLVGLMTWTVTSFFLSAETARMFWIVVGLSLALPKLLASAEPRPYFRSSAPTSYPVPRGR